MSQRFLALVALAFSFSISACVVTPADCAGRVCDTGTPSGPTYGKDANGRVAVSASQAWPGRTAEPAALTPGELAKACVMLGACLDTKDSPATLTGLCVGPDGSEERAIPEAGKNERRSWVLRATLLGGTCATLLTLETPRPNEIQCQEDGCWWSGGSVAVPKVTCTGDIAHLTIDGRVVTRDCTRAYQKCDANSPTGCTDRMPTACDSSAKDRCDGTIKLGCDSAGRVSFHDCGRVAGGTCVEAGDGSASCVYPNRGTCSTGASACSPDGTSVTVCVSGETRSVDCTTIGYTKCDAGRCVK